jgi:putative FmdB family regulatory protein
MRVPNRRSLFATPSTCDEWDSRPPEAPLPRYDYRCADDACENDTFEVSKSYTDDSITVCPVCNVEAKRLLSPIAVHFKGSGFYVTDNRAANGASEVGSGSDSSENGSKSDSESESKTEKKSEPKSEKKSDSGSKSSTSDKSEPKSKSPSSDSKNTSKATSPST